MSVQFWQDEACGERVLDGGLSLGDYRRHAQIRYQSEPYILPFAAFPDAAGLRVLEIGVGLGADHLQWARGRPDLLCGIDRTERAVSHTRRRLELEGFAPALLVGDALQLPYPDGAFDLVYSWGVLHHTPDPETAVREIHRVLHPGGVARVMLYRRAGLSWRVLWLYHALRSKRLRSLDEVIAAEVESEGTRAFRRSEVQGMFRPFRSVVIRPQLTMGDLLVGPIGRRHGGRALDLARRVWPRRLIRMTGHALGSDWLIEARK